MDADESFKINSDDESLPYKKEPLEDSPLAADDNVKVADYPGNSPAPDYPYGQPQPLNQEFQRSDPISPPSSSFSQSPPADQTTFKPVPFNQGEIRDSYSPNQFSPYNAEQQNQPFKTIRPWSGETEIN